MDIVRLSILKPVGVTVAVLLVVMFGLIGLGAIPIQLAPNVDRPIITVSTSWPGRSPQEIVDQITKEQEEQLKNVENLKSLRSTSSEGSSQITLEFYIEANIDRAMQDVSDSLRQVPEYPEDVDEPVVTATEGDAENAIAWIIIDFPPDVRDQFEDFDIATLYDALDKEVKPYLERVDGVAEVNIFGGREREVRVLIDPVRLAQRGLSYNEVAAALRSENRNTSAGSIAEGKRDYRVRVVGQFESDEDILATIVAYRDGKPVYLRDVGAVEMGHQKRRGFVRNIGGQAIAINAKRKTGSNVMAVMDGLQERLEVVKADILPTLDPVAGPHLRMRQVYDETTYIRSAIDLVMQNLWVGGILAGLVLWLFLRSLISTGVIALAIPTSIIGTFLVMLALGRSLNVISLAGMAFAVGMVVDNAIVVLENIYRRLQNGEPPMTAAYRGGREVWGAILASTLTTVAVFIPALTIQEEAGQLFRDISLAIVAAVSLSLLVSITVIPAACSRWLRSPKDRREPRTKFGRAWRGAFGLAALASALNKRIKRTMLWLMTGWRGWTLRPAVILFMTAASIVGAYLLMPPLDYLPAGNRNLVFGGLLIPPGYSIEQQEDVARRLERYLEPYMTVDASDDAAVAQLDPIRRNEAPNEPFDPVPIENMFVGAFGGGMFVGASSAYEETVIPIGTLITNAMNTVPGAFGGARQSSIFGRGVAGSGNSINIEISGPRLDRVRAAAEMTFNIAAGRYGYGNVRPTPSNYNLAQPEYQVRVTREGRELGVRPVDIGLAVRSLFDGGFVGDFREADGETIDIVMLPRNGRLESFQELASIPVATPAGPVVPLDTIVEIVPATAPQEILRIEELPSVQIAVTPPGGAALEQTISEIENEVLGAVRAAGLLDDTMRVRLEGTAAELTNVKNALFGAPATGPQAPWQIAVEALSALVALAGVGVGGFVLFRAIRRRERAFAYGAVGAVLMGVAVGGLFFGLGAQPSLLTARLVWALAVTYLLMCALFESFIYPFVIMFSVPLAVVGGFLGLRIVHDWTMMDPTRAPQQLDVLTMLGFVILIGVVVNNAILIVHQALNFMHGRFGEGETDDAGAGTTMPPLEAIAESVRTRIRPIFMSTLTSVGGMLPLVLFPGPGSEMYRGLGSVVIGGLLMSTIFTLVLVPLLFSLTLQMTEGLRAALKNEAPSERGHGDAPPPPKPERPEMGDEPSRPALEPALAMRTARA
jgi:HAE1 family hydrophobic/amphiphilic exporter-1